MASSLAWVAGSRTPRRVYVARVLNYGTWDEWQALKRRFGKRALRNAVRNPLPGQWTRRGRALAEVLFQTRLPDEALISYGP